MTWEVVEFEVTNAGELGDNQQSLLSAKAVFKHTGGPMLSTVRWTVPVTKNLRNTLAERYDEADHRAQELLELTLDHLRKSGTQALEESLAKGRFGRE